MEELWQRSRLRRAAQRYAQQGWLVVPGAVLIRDRYVCGPLCPTVACHPALDQWEIAASSDSSDVGRWWRNEPFSVLLATGHSFDVIDVPGRVGAVAADAAALGPVAVTPADRWLFLVAPGGTLRPELAEQLDVVMHGSGSWIPAPPTRTPGGRVRWHVSPSVTEWRLPQAEAVQRTLVAQLRRFGRPATFATTTPRRSRAA
jgi:Bifunctional DNA primase/polymerase, N-terminal